MELQNDLKESARLRCTDDNNSEGVFLVPQADRLTLRQHFLNFVSSYSMFLPNFLFNEGLYNEFVEPQFKAILSATS